MWPLITRSILIQSTLFSHDCHTLDAAMVTCRGRREGVREVRCLCFNGRDIYTQSHMHRHLSAPVFLPRFTLEDLQVQKKHTTVIVACLRGLSRGNSFFVCKWANDKSPCIKKLHNLDSLEDLMSSKKRCRAIKFAIVDRDPKGGKKHHSPASFEGWKG